MQKDVVALCQGLSAAVRGTIWVSSCHGLGGQVLALIKDCTNVSS